MGNLCTHSSGARITAHATPHAALSAYFGHRSAPLQPHQHAALRGRRLLAAGCFFTFF